MCRRRHDGEGRVGLALFHPIPERAQRKYGKLCLRSRCGVIHTIRSLPKGTLCPRRCPGLDRAGAGCVPRAHKTLTGLPKVHSSNLISDVIGRANIKRSFSRRSFTRTTFFGIVRLWVFRFAVPSQQWGPLEGKVNTEFEYETSLLVDCNLSGRVIIPQVTRCSCGNHTADKGSGSSVTQFTVRRSKECLTGAI